MESTIFFYIILFLILLCIFAFIICKNLFYSLTAAMFTFVLTGFIFYFLKSEYNAFVQVAVYGIAIPVILGLSLIFNQENKYKQFKNLSNNLNYLCVIAGCLLLSFCFYFLITMNFCIFCFNIQTFSIDNNTLNNLGSALFKDYVIIFEMISIILTVTIIGFSLYKNEVKK